MSFSRAKGASTSCYEELSAYGSSEKEATRTSTKDSSAAKGKGEEDAAREREGAATRNPSRR